MSAGSPHRLRAAARRAVAAGLLAALLPACAQTLDPPLEDTLPTPETRATHLLEVAHTSNRLTGPYADGRAEQLRGSWTLPGGHVLRGELLDEKRFGAHGGLVALGYTHVLSPRWNASAAFAAGHGGPIWPQRRIDLDLGRAWGEQLAWVTRLGWYDARYEGGRSDGGWRVSGAAYLPGGWSFEAGTVLNISQPGQVRSAMPYLAATQGLEGDYYLSLRWSRGREAYQAVGPERQIANFPSHSASLTGRLWLGPLWGMTGMVEQYVNGSSRGYRRTSLSLGLFYQW